MASLFETACFDSTLRTLRLRPSDILSSRGRLPANENDPLLDVARPTWIGGNYRQGGVLLIAKNPTGESATHRAVLHPPDLAFAAALKTLRDERTIEAYRAWRDHAQPAAMAAWRVWTISVKAVLAALHPVVRDQDDVAFGTLMPFRTVGNYVEGKEFQRAWERVGNRDIALLKPSLIVKMTAEFHGFDSLSGTDRLLKFRRANRDRVVTQSGLDDLARIAEWAAAHRDDGRQDRS